LRRSIRPEEQTASVEIKPVRTGKTADLQCVDLIGKAGGGLTEDRLGGIARLFAILKTAVGTIDFN